MARGRFAEHPGVPGLRAARGAAGPFDPVAPAPAHVAAALRAVRRAGGVLDGAIRTHHRGLQNARRVIGAGLIRMQPRIEQARAWNGPSR